MLYQYGNPDNAGAHYATTGPEILADLPTITHFVAGLGTTGTLMGVGRYLREKVPGVADRRRRAALRRPRLRPAQPRRGLRPRALRRVRAHHPLLRRLRGRGPPHPRTPPAGGHLRGRLHRRRPARRRSASPRKAVKAGERADVVFVVADGGWKYLSTGIYTATTTEAAVETLHGQLWA